MPQEPIYEAEPVRGDSYSYEATEPEEPLYEAAPEDPRQSAPGGATGNSAEAMFDYQAGERNLRLLRSCLLLLRYRVHPSREDVLENPYKLWMYEVWVGVKLVAQFCRKDITSVHLMRE